MLHNPYSMSLRQDSPGTGGGTGGGKDNGTGNGVGGGNGVGDEVDIDNVAKASRKTDIYAFAILAWLVYVCMCTWII